MIVRELSHFAFFWLLLVLCLVLNVEATAVFGPKIDDQYMYSSGIDSSLETPRSKLISRRVSLKSFSHLLDSSDETGNIKEISSSISPRQDEIVGVHGGWTDLTDLSNENLVVASVYVLNQIISGNSPFNVTFDSNATASAEIHILSAKLQIVSGLNLNFSMAVLLDHHCVGVFAALVHLDLKGNPEISQWGSETSCTAVEDAIVIPAASKTDADATSSMESSDAPRISPTASFALSSVSPNLPPTGIPAPAKKVINVPIKKQDPSQIQETLTPTVSPSPDKHNALSPGASESSVSMLSNEGQKPSAPADSNWIPIEKTSAPETLSPTPTKTSESGFTLGNLVESQLTNSHFSTQASLVSSRYQQTNAPAVSPAPTKTLESGVSYGESNTYVPTVSPAPTKIYASLVSFNDQGTSAPTISLTPTKYSDISPVAMESSVSKFSYEDLMPTTPLDSHWIPIEKKDAPTAIPARMNASDMDVPYDPNTALSLAFPLSTKSPTGSEFLSATGLSPTYLPTVTSTAESSPTHLHSTSSMEKPPIEAAPVPSIGFVPCIGFELCQEGCN